MPDVAVLGIKVENGDVIKATASLEGLTVAGAKSEAATQRLTRRMALLELEARNMDASITRNASAVGRMQNAMEAAERVVPGLTGAMKALSAIAVVGFIGRKTIEETEQAQAAMAQLEAAVASTGGAAGRTVKQLDELSMALQRQTAYSDEAVKGAEAILLTFDKIKGETFDRATRDVTDLAARLGKDLPEAALQVGKALQSPIDGMQALQRLGVRFTDSQKEMVKQLVETGHAAQAQAMILDELEKKFGGSAAAARDTLGGALAGLKNAWGDLFEVTKDGSQGTVNALNAITDWLGTSGLSMNKILKDATVDWETMRASIEKARAILSLPIGKGFLEQAKAISQRIDFDLSTKIAELNNPGKVGVFDPEAARRAAAEAAAEAQRADAAALKRHLANQDLVRDAEQALDLAGLQGAEQERMRIIYEAQNKAIEAQRTLKGALLAETLKAIDAEEALKLQTVDRAEQLKVQHDAIEAAKQQLDSMEEDFTSKLSKSLAKVFGTNNPLRGLFESLTKDLLTIWVSRFVEPAAAAMLGINLTAMGRAGVLTGASGHGGVADASVSMAPNKLIPGALGAIAGAGIGYGTGNGAFGALGGGLAAFSMGAGPVGIAVSALAGLAGGILGAGKAAREAAKQLEVVRQAFKDAMAQFEATASGDSLAQQIAQVHSQADALRQQAEASVSNGAKLLTKVFGQAFADAAFGTGPNNLAGNLAHITQIETDYIAKLQAEAAIKAQQATEDLAVRTLRNQGLGHEADVQAKINQDAREYAEAQKAGMSDAYLASLKWNQSVEEAAVAAGKASDAMHSLADGLNQVAGYNLARAVFGNASPFSVPNTTTSGGGGFMPTAPRPTPMSTSGPSLSTSDSGDLHVTLEVSGEKMGTVVLKNFKQQAQRQYGDSTQWGRIQ